MSSSAMWRLQEGENVLHSSWPSSSRSTISFINNVDDDRLTPPIGEFEGTVVVMGSALLECPPPPQNALGSFKIIVALWLVSSPFIELSSIVLEGSL